MGVSIPPAPARHDASDVMARMSQFRKTSRETADEETGAAPQPLLIASCALSAIGIVMLACAIFVVCAPESSIAHLVMRVCAAIA